MAKHFYHIPPHLRLMCRYPGAQNAESYTTHGPCCRPHVGRYARSRKYQTRPVKITSHIADLLRQREAAYAEYRRLSDLDRSDDETDVPFNEWCDLADEILQTRAETWGDVLAQQRVATYWAEPGGGGGNLSFAEERWIVGLSDTIRRLGASWA